MADKTFIQKCLDGEEEPDTIDDYVDYWHDAPIAEVGVDLPAFLGMTKEQYNQWAVGIYDIEVMLEDIKATQGDAHV